jgi:hypothetical protein
MGLVHAGHAHRVDVAVEHERPAAAGAAQHADDVGAVRRAGVLYAHVEPALAQPVRDVAGDLRLAGSTRDERGVDRVDCDELHQEIAQGLIDWRRHS